MPPTVDALVPLSLLEAVRMVDTPDRDLDDETEYVGELRSKRLGLSDTVGAQIRRYAGAARQKQRLPMAEASAIARLVARRPDAEQVFRDGGAYLARRAYQRIPPVTRWVARSLPAFLSRPIALRSTRRIAARYYNGTVERVGAFVILAIQDSPVADAAPREVGCSYFEASFGELLRRLLRTVGRVEHIRCVARGDSECQWRADWRHSR